MTERLKGHPRERGATDTRQEAFVDPERQPAWDPRKKGDQDREGPLPRENAKRTPINEDLGVRCSYLRKIKPTCRPS